MLGSLTSLAGQPAQARRRPQATRRLRQCPTRCARLGAQCRSPKRRMRRPRSKCHGVATPAKSVSSCRGWLPKTRPCACPRCAVAAAAAEAAAGAAPLAAATGGGPPAEGLPSTALAVHWSPSASHCTNLNTLVSSCVLFYCARVWALFPTPASPLAHTPWHAVLAHWSLSHPPDAGGVEGALCARVCVCPFALFFSVHAFPMLWRGRPSSKAHPTPGPVALPVITFSCLSPLLTPLLCCCLLPRPCFLPAFLS